MHSNFEKLSRRIVSIRFKNSADVENSLIIGSSQLCTSDLRMIQKILRLG